MAARRVKTAVLLCALGGCAAQQPLPSSQPVGDAPQAIPADFVVSTNEPFWQARVEGDAVVLTGPDARRVFTVVRNDAVFDGRSVVARDAQGTLELRVTQRLCQDSMAGESFDYTARLTLDGQPPVPGCGRPRVAGQRTNE